MRGGAHHQSDRETRLEYQAEAILAELAAYLRQGPPELDYITLAGSGEPTLNLGLGRIIRRIKALTGTPVAVLTNGALLYLPEVRRTNWQAADLVLPSLDAAREETFRAINRPLPDYPLSRLIEGLEAFRREYSGQIWLEILLLKGLNDSPADLEALRRALKLLAPDKVQLNTAVRPGVEDYARPLNLAEMDAIATYLGRVEVEVIAAGNGAASQAVACDDAVLVEMLARRPMTAADLARVLGLPLPLVRQRLLHLCETGQVAGQPYCDQEFYRQVSEA